MAMGVPNTRLSGHTGEKSKRQSQEIYSVSEWCKAHFYHRQSDIMDQVTQSFDPWIFSRPDQLKSWRTCIDVTLTLPWTPAKGWARQLLRSFPTQITQGDPEVEVETSRAEVIQKSPMYQCLGTTGNLEGSSPEASQIKRQKIISFTYVGIWWNFFKELSKCTML